MDFYKKAAVFIPSYNSENDLRRLLDSLKNSLGSLDIIIVDSSSKDGSVDLAKKYTSNIKVIDKNTFDHGGTRQSMIEDNAYEFCIFMTQDAYLASPNSILEILKPFTDPHVGAVCGRQLPHKNANPLAQHARYFNYPDEYKVKSLSDKDVFGLKTAFISNSFAAYRRSALLSIGGFPSKLILSEDMYAAAKMLICGWKIVYNNKATCYHSHNYTLFEEFKRYFDIGVFHYSESWISETLGGVSGEGWRYVKSEIGFLKKVNLFYVPRSIILCGLKFVAFSMGKKYRFLPKFLVKKLSMNSRFWNEK